MKRDGVVRSWHYRKGLIPPISGNALVYLEEIVDNLLANLVITGHTTCAPAEAPFLICLTIVCMCKRETETTPNHLNFWVMSVTVLSQDLQTTYYNCSIQTQL